MTKKEELVLDAVRNANKWLETPPNAQQIWDALPFGHGLTVDDVKKTCNRLSTRSILVQTGSRFFPAQPK